MLLNFLDPCLGIGPGPRNQHARDGLYQDERGCVRRKKVWTFSSLNEVIVGVLQARKGAAVGQNHDRCTFAGGNLGLRGSLDGVSWASPCS